MIGRVLIVVTFALTAQGAIADTLTDLRPDFINGCVDAGNDAPMCGCLYDNWSTNLTEDQHPLAATAISMFLGEMPQDPQQMMAATTMLQDMTSVLLQCASGGLEVTQQGTNPPIPQTGDAIEEQLLYERVTAGGTIEEMSRYAALVEARKAREGAEEARVITNKNARAEVNNVTLRASYEAELARIHARPIDDWPVTEFETLYVTYCQMGGGTHASCVCAWPILKELSTYNAAAYLAARSEGDDVFDRVSMADVSSVYFTHEIFHERKAVCE